MRRIKETLSRFFPRKVLKINALEIRVLCNSKLHILALEFAVKIIPNKICQKSHLSIDLGWYYFLLLVQLISFNSNWEYGWYIAAWKKRGFFFQRLLYSVKAVLNKKCKRYLEEKFWIRYLLNSILHITYWIIKLKSLLLKYEFL